MSEETSIVDRLIEHFGNIKETANGLSKDIGTIMTWRKKGYIPAPWAYHVEERTKGAIKASEVRLAALNSTAKPI